MSKKILIISTSLRGGSNSEILAKECERGALANSNDVEKASAERTYLAQIEEKYPYKADFEGELEQINVAKEVYLANQNGLQM